MKKKLVSMLLVACLAFGLVGCGGDDSNKKTDSGNKQAAADDKSGGGDSKTIKVGIINLDPNESGYRTANVEDLKKKFTADNGYEASFAYSKKNDEQITAAKKFINDGVDYLLLSAADTAGWDGVLQDAKTAGTKVLLFDRTIKASEDLYEASIVSDMAKEGETAVNWLKDQNMDEYNIIHIQGEMGNAAQIGRTDALNKQVEADSKWKLITQQAANWNAEQAQQIVQSVIDSGKKFNVIYAENDDMANGATKALDKNNISYGVGKDVIIMGFDCNKFALRNVMNKKWNYDGQCNPFQAEELDKIIQKLEKGEKLDQKQIIMEEQGFDSDNVTEEVIEKYGIGKDLADMDK